MEQKVILSKGEKYYPISAEALAEVYPGKVPFALYYRINDSFEVKTNKDIRTPFLRECDIITYTQQLLLKNKLKVNEHKNVILIAENLQQVLLLLREQGLTTNNVKLVESIAESIVELSFNPSLNKLFSSLLTGHTQHYFLRTIVAKAISQQLQWTSFSTIYKLTLASMLVNLPDLLTKGWEETEMVLNSAGLPSDIIQIIKHSKENNDATGPFKTKKYQIHPLARVVRVADEFSQKVLFEKMNKDKFFEYIQPLTPLKFDSQSVNALKKFLTPLVK